MEIGSPGGQSPGVRRKCQRLEQVEKLPAGRGTGDRANRPERYCQHQLRHRGRNHHHHVDRRQAYRRLQRKLPRRRRTMATRRVQRNRHHAHRHRDARQSVHRRNSIRQRRWRQRLGRTSPRMAASYRRQSQASIAPGRQHRSGRFRRLLQEEQRAPDGIRRCRLGLRLRSNQPNFTDSRDDVRLRHLRGQQLRNRTGGCDLHNCIRTLRGKPEPERRNVAARRPQRKLALQSERRAGQYLPAPSVARELTGALRTYAWRNVRLHGVRRQRL